MAMIPVPTSGPEHSLPPALPHVAFADQATRESLAVVFASQYVYARLMEPIA